MVPLTPIPYPPRPPSGSFRRRPSSTVVAAASASLPRDVREALADPSRRLGEHHVLLEEIGRGGMGVVYRGYDLALHRTVAVKMVLHAERAGEETLQRFAREAQSAAKLRHPNIVAVHEVGDRDGVPYLVMDHVEGSSLDEAAAGGPLAPRRAATLVHDLARALAHAHEVGVVHRDVKPQNVLLDAEGRPRLTDFGLARETDSHVGLTRSGAFIGTPGYAPPEQVSGRQDQMGPASDVYAAGAVLYFALTGQPPFTGDSLMEVVMASLRHDPVSPRKRNAAVHVDLETIALHCLEKEPARRFGSAAELADDLRRFLDGEPIRARPPGRGERFSRWLGRNRAPVVAGVALVVIAAALVAGAFVLVPAARARAARGERAALVATAEADAVASREAFERLRGADETTGSDALISAGRAALGDAQQRLRVVGEVGGDEAAAAVAVHRVAMALGEAATTAGQWGVARSAYDDAGAVGVDPAAAAAALVELERARGARTDRRRRAVLAALDDARSGRLVERDLYDRALFTVVGERDPETVALLVEALDEISASLRAATLETYAAAIEALPGIVDPAVARSVVERACVVSPADLDAGERRVLGQASLLIEAHAAMLEGRELLDPRAPSYWEAIGRAQSDRIGEGGRRLALLCCEALGRLGIREGAVAALGRLLGEWSEEAAIAPAGIALCQLGGAEAQELVLIARDRWSENGPFWRRVEPHLKEIEVAAELESVSAVGFARRARVRASKGDHAAAIADYTRALELDPGDELSWNGRARSRWAKGDLEGAASDFGEAIELDEGFAGGWNNRGLIYRQLGRLDDAIADFTRAIELAPRYPGSWSNRAIAYRTRGDGPAALADAVRAVELGPRYAETWINVGLIRMDAGDLDGAIADFTTAIELDDRLAIAWLDRGKARASARDFEGAISDYDRAIEIDPRYANAYNNRGIARYERGELAAAIADYDRAIEIDPENADAHSNRGNARDGMGDHAGAIADFTRAIALEPDDPSWYVNRALSRTSLGELDGAIADCDRALELDPDFEAAWCNRGNARRDKGELVASLADLDRAVELGPRSPECWNSRALTLELLGRVDDAIADLSRALELAPRFAAGFVNRGMMRNARKDHDGAIADYTRALEIAPLLSDAWLARGVARISLGRLVEARADLAHFLDLSPGHRSAPLAEQAIAEIDVALQRTPPND